MQAFFLSAGPRWEGQRFCLYHRPTGPVRGIVVHLHAFAEEMNKSRHMVALQARAMAQAGHAVLQIDLLGCGDSGGDFADATWDDWIADGVLAATWLAERHAGAPLWLWGLRAGCLLARDVAERLPAPAHLLFWQPPTAGKALLQQFLRLRLAGQWIEGKTAGAMDELKAALRAGATLEIAGYGLGRELAQGLEVARLRPPLRPANARWIEVSTRNDAVLLPATETVAGQWRDAGCKLTAVVVPGPAFWQTQEIEQAPALLTATLEALKEAAL